MNDELRIEFKLNKILPKLSKKLGMDYRIVRIGGGFKIFTAENKLIAYVSLIDKKFELFDEFKNVPRYLRRMLIEDLRFITLFDVNESEIEKRFA